MNEFAENAVENVDIYAQKHGEPDAYRLAAEINATLAIAEEMRQLKQHLLALGKEMQQSNKHLVELGELFAQWYRDSGGGMAETYYQKGSTQNPWESPEDGS